MRPSPLDGAELAEQRLCLGERRARRRIEERELLGRAAPGRQVKRERRQIGRQNLRPGKRFERGGLRLVPEPVADAGLGTAGAAAPLIGGRTRDAYGFEPRHADIGLVARHARKPGIDDHAHALDGDRGLGNRRRQHDLAPARRGWSNGAVLLVAGERAIERDDVNRRIEAAFKLRGGTADFGGAGKKRQHRAGIGAHGADNGVGDLRLDRPRVAAEIAGLDGESAAFGCDDRGVAQKLCHACAVERRRHDQRAANPRASQAGRRGRAPARDRRRASVRGIRRTGWRRRRRASDRRAPAG